MGIRSDKNQIENSIVINKISLNTFGILIYIDKNFFLIKTAISIKTD